MRLLQEHGANVNSLDDDGNALHQLISFKCLSPGMDDIFYEHLLEFLLQAGVDVTAVDALGRSAWEKAVDYNDEMATQMISRYKESARNVSYSVSMAVDKLPHKQFDDNDRRIVVINKGRKWFLSIILS